MEKKILEGYIGVKFEAQCLGDDLPPGCESHIASFTETGNRLLQYNMAPANGGNMSLRFGGSFLVTASGSNLGCMEKDEVVYVEDFSIPEKWVKYRGRCVPSSESILHGSLLREKQEVSAVIHAHDEAATSRKLAGVIRETGKEEPYGTVELAAACLDTFKEDCRIIVLKNHGYVAVGGTLEHAAKIIIDMHHRLLEEKK